MMLATLGPLSIDGDVLKDRAGRVVGILRRDVGHDTFFAYIHVFAASAELFRFMEDQVTRSVAGLEAHESRMKQEFSNSRPAYGCTRYSAPPAWLEKGIQAVAMAKGDDVQPDDEMMMPGPNALIIKDNILKDDSGQIVAVLSKELGEDKVSAYAHLFAASVHLLDIIDFLSSRELTEIEQACEAAREFNKLNNIPPDVPILGTPSPVIPDRLQKMLQIVAKAKGRE
jgi:hypothetical protein